MRLLFVSLEFSAGTFSGNGVLAQSQVRALAALGHQVFVVAGRPADLAAPPKPEGAFKLLEIPLTKWGRLDAGSPWEGFAAGCARYAGEVVSFQPHAVLGVDWTSLQPYYELAGRLHPPEELDAGALPFVYLVYRCFSRSVGEENHELLVQKERQSIAAASLVTALGNTDAAYIHEHLCDPSQPKQPTVLLPPLRSDMASIPPPLDTLLQDHQSNGDMRTGPAGPAPAVRQSSTLEALFEGGQARSLLTCCVRLSPEKEPQRFVELVEALAASGLLQQLQVTPALCGMAATDFAKQLQQRLRHACPSALVVDTFMGPADLACIYARTRLNFHPCLYDAYGMTVVEAGSQGAPTVLHSSGDVGATDLLRPAAHEALTLDFCGPMAALAQQVAQLLVDEPRLRLVGSNAAARARAWTESTMAHKLVQLVTDYLKLRKTRDT